MHSPVDPADLVPHELEQLRDSGYQIGTLHRQALDAAVAGDLQRLAAIERQIPAMTRDPAWPYDEPDEVETLRALVTGLPVVPSGQDLTDRLEGAWVGRAVGNTMGKPVEGLTRTEVRAYLEGTGQWPQTGYLRFAESLPPGVTALHGSARVATLGNFTEVPRDDDLDWTILGLLVLEKYGTELTSQDIATEWLDRLPFTQTFTAERVAYRNLANGLQPPATATTANPYREWIGALIRGDAFGYVSPGDPGRAARLVLQDARISHVGNGTYGEMWAAAFVAAGLTATALSEAFDVALRVVPPRSRLAEALGEVRALRQQGAGAEEAVDWIDERLGHYNWVHTINNAAIIATGLLWGNSFVEAIAITVGAGRDTDSTAATVGSVYGAVHGASAIPAELVGTTHRRIRSSVRDFDRVPIDELVERTVALTRT